MKGLSIDGGFDEDKLESTATPVPIYGFMDWLTQSLT